MSGRAGRNIVTVASRVDAAGGHPETCVLHYKPASSLYPGHTPTYYAAVSDAYIIYPWEIDRGPEVSWCLELIAFLQKD